MESVSAWLRRLGLERYAGVFADNDVDAEALALLTEGDLERLGVTLGHRKKLLLAIAKLSASPLHSGEEPSPYVAPSRDAERRQISVMFCDLVGSTALAERLDPEELRDLLQAYQRACGEAIRPYGGHVAQYLGDGLMVYFGWPQAHEDNAERAIQAGLEVLNAVARVRTSTPIRARVGIHTGLVVVGETGAGDPSIPKAAVGETPNIAARLQGLAPPGSVVVTERTRALASGLFEYHDMGAHVLKGLSEPIRLYRVTGTRPIESRFEASRGSVALTPLVGRDEEIGLLLDLWRRARDGAGQVALVSGDPGIGKSRLARAMRERLVGEPHLSLRYQCSPFHVNTALHPVAEHVERIGSFGRDDNPEQKLDKMESLLAGSRAQIAEAAPLYAAMLSLPTGRYPPVKRSPQKHKEKTLQALLGQVAALSKRQPLLMVFEDAQWTDATSQEMLDLLVTQLPSMPVLLMITFRPEYMAPWSRRGGITELRLGHLGRTSAAQLVDSVSGGKTLPHEVLAEILAHTDGVPLFIEELTKSVLESGLLQEERDRHTLQSSLPLAIPTTLRDSLIARLDRLAPIREVAQVGACIGREFSYDLLVEVSGLDESALTLAMEQLTQSGLIYRRGTPPDVMYAFKHALVQDAAYDSLLKSKRLQLHARIGQALETRFPARVASEPELVARHLTQAGLDQRAAPYWLRAGQRALNRVALVEALGHLNAALSVNGRLPPSLERDRQELDIRMLLGQTYLAYLGWAAVEVVQVLGPARDLAIRLEEDTKLVAILHYIWFHHSMRCEFTRTLAIVAELDALARSREDSVPFVVARWTEGLTHCWMGNFKQSREVAEQVLRAYDPKLHGQLVETYSHDPKCGTLSWLQASLWALGFPDQAKQAALAQLEVARQLGNPFNLCWCLTGGTMALLLRGETALARQWVAEALAIAREHAMTFIADVMVPASDGYALIEQGDYAEGYAKHTAAVGAWEEGGALFLVPFANLYRARALMGLNRHGEARNVLDRGLELVQRTGHRMHEAELHRMHGELLRQQPQPDLQGAENAFRRALEIARTQEAKGFELRAAMSLARLWTEQDRRCQALELMEPVYSWFTEGFDTPDLGAARGLLSDLK
jgi:class 3 adenylate cyclase/predicted ATPase